jgi:hypothetical protein
LEIPWDLLEQMVEEDLDMAGLDMAVQDQIFQQLLDFWVQRFFAKHDQIGTRKARF